MSAGGAEPLHATLLESLREAGVAPGATIVVALSGGLDSCVLLHLLRFGRLAELRIVAAHYDHAMRPGSGADADWVRGLCRAWSVPCTVERAGSPPGTEAEARTARYAFLDRVRSREGAERVLTAHHADDQAETVLFRVLRGTGIDGLAGVPERRDGWILRPLLGHWRDELAAYAGRVRLTWRDDPTNDTLDHARNVVRHRLLPEAEATFAPGARRALVRLARLAAAEARAWDALLEPLLGRLEVDAGADEIAISRDALLAQHPAVQARLLRSIVARLGRDMDERGTGVAVQFSSSGRSGGGVSLGGGVELRRRLDRLVVLIPPEVEADETLTIADGGPGRGVVRLAGRPIAVSWGGCDGTADEAPEALSVPVERLPLVVRAPSPGDRIRLPGGTKKLKKLLLEARIPADRRGQVPVVVDARGAVVWVPGVARSVEADGVGDGPVVRIGIDT